MSEVMPSAEPFVYRGNSTGCLLVHGFTGTPQEMRRLGQFLNNRGFTIHGVLLAGHGTNVHDLNVTTWRDWYNSVYEGWQALSDSCTQVFAIGLSLGGALALHLAAHVPLCGVVSLATALELDTKLLYLTRVLKYLLPYRKKAPSDIHDPQVLAARIAYDRTPTRSAEQALLFFRHLYDDLPDIRLPVLLMHSRHDTAVDPATMPLVYERLGTKEKQMVWLENSGHIITEDYDRQFVYTSIHNFIKRHSTSECQMEASDHA